MTSTSPAKLHYHRNHPPSPRTVILSRPRALLEYSSSAGRDTDIVDIHAGLADESLRPLVFVCIQVGLMHIQKDLWRIVRKRILKMSSSHRVSFILY